jgi:transglutaminase/protease-like cytokinesis protein 3
MAMRYIMDNWIHLGLIIMFMMITSVDAQDYERVDATIQLYPSRCDTPEDLSKFISRDFNTDAEKVRAIYSWIIQNIEYEPKEYKKFDYSFRQYRERNIKEEETRKKIIDRTIQKGIAVCEGYAMLFEGLCELLGVNSYLVRGDTKSNFEDIGRSFQTVHMWNVAFIDGKPYLFDTTWGAGKYHQRFIRDTSYFYFKTDPDKLIKTHYPDLYEDAFLDEAISRDEFSSMPLIIERSMKYTDLIQPESGIIHSEMYFDEIQFSVKANNPEKIYYSYGGEKDLVNKIKRDRDTVHFSVPLLIGQQNLLIYFDQKPALGFKVK